VPTYTYACTDCDEQLEVVQSFTADPLTECPRCGGRLRKVFHPVGVVFKGSGFYRTDSRSTGKAGKGSSGAGAGAATSSNKSGTSGSGDAGSTSGGGESSGTSGGAQKSGSAASSGGGSSGTSGSKGSSPG